MQKIMLSLIQRTIHWLLPPTCVLCGKLAKREIDLCQPCEEELPWLQYSCWRCGLSLSTIPSSEPQYCGYCLQTPPVFKRTVVLFHYQNPITHLITHLKYGQQLIFARLLGELMTQRLAQYYTCTKPEYIIPVPLHPQRLRQRGFNQALELARPIAKQLQIPIDMHSCQRIKATRPQSLITADERKINLKNAFVVNKNFKAQHVAIIDDVMTTAETVKTLSHALQQAGVMTIEIWSCARTNLNH